MNYTIEELLEHYRNSVKRTEKFSLDMNSRDYINARELEEYYKEQIIKLVPREYR